MPYTIAMRFEVPQFIEIEDKIFGPFTWRQFIYLGGGVGMAVVLFFVAPFIVFVIFGVPVGALAILLAFYPVNNRPFSAFLEALVYFYKNSRVYYWRKKSNIVYREKNALSEASFQIEYTRGSGDIASLSRKLELNALQKK